MARVTSKLQVTIPKAIADRYGIAPGDEIEWLPAGEGIRVVPEGRNAPGDDRAYRLRLFDAATERLGSRQSGRPATAAQGRGWRREQLYERGGAG